MTEDFTLFLSHPRKGDIEGNLKDADRISKILKNLNLVEPFKEIPQDGTVNEYDAMERCIRLLLACDGIIMSGKWKNSKNCNLEREIAEATGKAIYEFNSKINLINTSIVKTNSNLPHMSEINDLILE